MQVLCTFCHSDKTAKEVNVNAVKVSLDFAHTMLSTRRETGEKNCDGARKTILEKSDSTRPLVQLKSTKVFRGQNVDIGLSEFPR